MSATTHPSTLDRGRARLVTRIAPGAGLRCTVLAGLALLGLFASSPAVASDLIGIRTEDDIGRRSDGLGNSDWATTRGASWSPIPRMAANFVAEEPETSVAVTFSAEAEVDQPGRRMFVRALVDGQAAAPHDVVFTSGTLVGVRSFVFTAQVGAGIHTVQMEWLVDAGAEARIRDAGILVRTGRSELSGEGGLVVVTPVSGPPLEIGDTGWIDVPGLSGEIEVGAGADLTVTASVESWASSKASLYLRALIDGSPARPANITFARGISPRVRAMTFGAADASGGVRSVRIQALAQAGGTGFVGDRSLVLSALSDGGAPGQRFFSPASGPPIETTSSSFEPIPGLAGLVYVPANGEVAVSFQAEAAVAGDGHVEVRLVFPGGVDPESPRRLLEGGQQGVNSALFAAEHVFPQSGIDIEQGGWFLLRMEWRRVGTGTALMGDRSIVAMVEQATVPDLTDPPELGHGGRAVEPARGPRPLLTVLWDPQRPGHPAPAIADLEQELFGAENSVADYYDEVSGGRLELVNAGVLGPVASDKPSGHYFGSHPECGELGSDGYTGGHQEKWVEALSGVDAEVDFAAWDRNRDGILDPHELAVLIVIPQASADGFSRPLRPYCSGALFTADGVVVPEISEWYTSLSTATDWLVATHELAHQLLGLDDMYVTGLETAPGRKSLMGIFGDATAHVDGVHKLALGWVTPRFAEHGGPQSLVDVKLSREVVVLGRLDRGEGKEYFLLENRQSSLDHPRYDERIRDSGIAVWHVVEDPPDYDDGDPIPPNCVDAGDWQAVSANPARRGIRLLRPRIEKSEIFALWSSEYYDLLDTGLVCPAGAPDPQSRRNALRWAEGVASGYRLTDWAENGDTAWFDVTVP